MSSARETTKTGPTAGDKKKKQNGKTARSIGEVTVALLSAALISAGMVPDGRGRSGVADILGWRGDGRNREALVRWTGCDEQGEPWADSWIPRSWLTSDLQSLGKIRAPRDKSERSDDAASDRVVCLRPSPRLAGVTPGPGMQ